VLDGADYIGCGPTFPSQTKQFESFPGVAFLREVSAETSLPAFAVGGIQTSNLKDVLATGFRRVAMSGALAISDDLPATVAMIRAEVKAAANRQT
jgi:thiamine-phosphate pyrophosphorylase